MDYRDSRDQVSYILRGEKRNEKNWETKSSRKNVRNKEN